MKKIGSYFTKVILYLMLTIFVTSLLPEHHVHAVTAQADQHIYDEANLLSSEEINSLNSALQTVNQHWGIHTFILTTDQYSAYDTDTYIDRFIRTCNDSHFYNDNCVVLLVNLQSRDVAISGYGRCKMYVSSSRATNIHEDITPSLSSGNYYNAFNAYINGVDHYMSIDPFYFQVWFQILIALILASLIVLIMAISRGSHVTTNANTYLDQEHSRVRFHHDNYIRTSVTRVKKPENNNNNSGGGSGRSHSHSSGKF